jgi:hypothetical protein
MIPTSTIEITIPMAIIILLNPLLVFPSDIERVSLLDCEGMKGYVKLVLESD